MQMVLHTEDPEYASYFLFYKWGASFLSKLSDLLPPPHFMLLGCQCFLESGQADYHSPATFLL